MNEIVFDKILKEYFDLSDRRSMKTMLSLNEAEQNQAMVALASKLYDKIVKKVDDIDFGTIPASKGDITKIGNYQDLRESLNIIREILVNYKQDTSTADIIDKAIENIKDSKNIWEKAYVIKSELPIVFYNTIVLSIVSSISLLISASIEFISNPNEHTFEISFDRVAYTKTKEKMLFKDLEKFNKAYASGEVEKAMNAIIKSTTNVKESTSGPITESIAFGALVAVVGTGFLVTTLLVTIVPLLHELTSILYCSRQKVSEYFEVQSKLVQFNAEQLKYNYTKSEAEIEKIYKKQIKIAEKFKAISNKYAVKMNKAEKDAVKEIEKDKSEKFKVEDLEVQGMEPISSSIF